MALQTTVSDRIFLSRFKAGLRSRLQNQATLVTEDSDTVVSIALRPFSAQKFFSRERVREGQEARAYSSAPQSFKGDKHHVEC